MKKTTKYLAILLSFVMLLSMVMGTSLAVVITQTQSVLNTFLSGFNPTGSIVIQKTIRHPFGSDYAVPDNENTRFRFTVDMGEKYAGATFGSFTADDKGRFDITVKANGSVTIPDIPVGTQATVTEHTPGSGFTAPESQTVTVSRGENLLTMVNEYKPMAAPVEDLTIRGSKTLVGRDWQEGDRFVFALEVKENDSWVELGRQTVEYILVEQPDPENPENTIFLPPENFDCFDFTQIIREYPLEDSGIYAFRVVEKEGTVPGITYDKTESRLDLTVGDPDMDGQLEILKLESPSANTDIQDLTVSIEFENEYAPLGSDDVCIDITKKLVDTSGQNKAPSGFIFELYDEKGEPIQISQPTDASGRTEIRLIYETKDAGRSFYYTLKEVDGGDRGMTYDESVYKIRVDVIGNQDGTVTAMIREDTSKTPVPELPAETEPVESEPEETEPEVTEPEVTEPEVTEPETAEPSEPEASAPAEPAPSEAETAAPSDPEPSESQNSESEASEPESTEAEPESSGMDAVPAAEKNPLPKEDSRIEVSFTNTYETKPVTLPVSGKKCLEGRELREGEFAFHLYRTEAGFHLPEDAVPIDTATNHADGNFFFSDLTFYTTGWYYYVITEDTSAALGGIVYDQNRFHLRVYVEDIGGRLSVQQASVENAAGENADIAFYNVYQPAHAQFSLSGQKILEGREMEAGEFTFQLYEASYLTSYGFSKGQLFARTTNDADGSDGTGTFTFSIEYPGAGTFHYIVAEKTGEEEGMTYDSAEYGIEVVVEDDLTGQLQARITRIVRIGEEDTEVQEILFRNTYTEPESTGPDETNPSETTSPDETTKPDETTSPTEPSGGKLPQTGQLWWPVPVLLFAGILLVLIGLIRRRGI